MLDYAGRIGERLRAATDEQVDNADADSLPVLASRARRVEDAVTDALPNRERRRVSVSQAGGVPAGRAAAEHPELNAAHRRLGEQ